MRVVKFKVAAQQLLIAYQFDSKRNTIEILDVGPHENFYRELQKYLDAPTTGYGGTRTRHRT